MRLITSLGKEQYHQYGKKMFSTLKENLELPVTVYSEDDLTIPNVELRPLRDVPGWQEFVDATNHLKPASYLWNAQKFSHKVFAQLDAFERDDKYVLWLDADVVLKKKVPTSFLKNMVKKSFVAYLGRGDVYSETGFLLFNTEHPDFDTFKERYASYYRDRYIFRLPYWIDCMAFDAARKGLQANNLTPGVEGMVDVFSRSRLDDYMQHDKGNLKHRRAG